MIGSVLIVNIDTRGGGAEVFSADLASDLHAPIYTKAGVKSIVDQVENVKTSPFGKALNLLLRTSTRHSTWRHLLGCHDSFHGTYKELSASSLYRNAEIVHLNNIHGAWFDLNALEKIDAEKKVIWTLHDMWAMTGGEAYMFDYTGHNIGQANSPYSDNYPLRTSGIDRRQHYLNYKKDLYSRLRNTTFVPVSDWLETSLRNSHVFNGNMKIQTIKNGVKQSIFSPTRTSNTKGIPRILFFNSPSPFKGSAIGIDSLEKVSGRFDLILVGDEVPTLSVHTHFPNYITSRLELAQLYQSVDFLLFPSLAENMPLTVLEAMACGVVPISFKTGGIPEIVETGVTGFLSPSKSALDLTTTIDIALNSDFQSVSIEASKFVARNHCFNEMVEKYQELYTS